MMKPVIDPRVKNIHSVIKTVFNITNFFGSKPWNTLRKMVKLTPPQLLEGIQSVDLAIPAATKSVYPGLVEPQEVRVRVYHPVAEHDAPKTEGKLPILIFFHGGAFVLGNAAQEPVDVMMRKFAKDGPMLVINVDYRLAPEHKLPAAIDDAMATILWVHSAEHPLIKEHGDPSRIVLMGESSGGTMVAVATQQLAKRKNLLLCLESQENSVFILSCSCFTDHPEVKVAHQVLICPSMQMPTDQPTESKRKYHDFYMCSQTASDVYRKAAYPDNAPELVNSALIQPLLGDNFGALPSLQMVVAQCDVLADEGKLYSDALKAAGVETHFHSYTNSVHGFFGMQFLPEAQAAYKDVLEGIKVAVK